MNYEELSPRPKARPAWLSQETGVITFRAGAQGKGEGAGPSMTHSHRGTKAGTSANFRLRAQWGNSGFHSVILALRNGHPPPGQVLTIVFAIMIFGDLFAIYRTAHIRVTYGGSDRSGAARILASSTCGLRDRGQCGPQRNLPLRQRVHRELGLLPRLRC